MDEVLYELGVDIGSSLSFHDGDIKLAKYDENLVQAIANQLNTGLDELELFYEQYGSVILGFLGWKGTDETISLIEAELETILKSESRLTDWEYNVEYIGKGKVKIDLVLYPNLTYSIDATLTLSEEGVEVVE